MSLIVYYTV